jgi:predicted methyltransferase
LLTLRGRRFLEHYLYLHSSPGPADSADPAGHNPCPITVDDLEPLGETLAGAFGRHPAAAEDPEADARRAEASLFRALVLCAHGALYDKAVIVLGDSALASVAIGLLGQLLGAPGTRSEHPPARIAVVETDPSWIELIEKTAHAEGLQIEVLRHNLRDPLPERLGGQFDTFVTDPPYTAAGMTLFISRAVQALRPGGGGQGLFSFAHQSPLELLQIHANLVRMGLVAREIIPGSGEVSAPQSQMMLLLSTPATRALVPQQSYEAPIYAGDTAPTVRFYVCTRCRARYRVGQQYAFVDVDALKQAGCARCGNRHFRYVHRVVPQGTLPQGTLGHQDLQSAWEQAGALRPETDLVRRALNLAPAEVE